MGKAEKPMTISGAPPPLLAICKMKKKTGNFPSRQKKNNEMVNNGDIFTSQMW